MDHNLNANTAENILQDIYMAHIFNLSATLGVFKKGTILSSKVVSTLPILIHSIDIIQIFAYFSSFQVFIICIVALNDFRQYNICISINDNTINLLLDTVFILSFPTCYDTFLCTRQVPHIFATPREIYLILFVLNILRCNSWRCLT